MSKHLPARITFSFFLLVFVVCLVRTADGHDPGLSSLTVTVSDRQIDLILGLAVKDAIKLGSDSSKTTPASEDFAAFKPVLESRVTQSIRLFFGDELAVPNQTVTRRIDSSNVEVLVSYSRGQSSRIRLISDVIGRLPFGHRQFLTARTETGKVLAQAMLSDQERSLSFDLPASETINHPASLGKPFFAFFRLGIEHILTGYDHLLFLIGLLVVCRDVKSILTVISCFTVAHSITLALAALDIVRLSGRVVEPLIAASIAYVGMENLLRNGSPRWRWLITFLFGLVHGLGFADALREFGIGTPGVGVVFPLVGFNLGVEAGQLAVAAIVLPILWQLRRFPVFVRCGVPVCSVLIALAGSCWMLERIGQP
jgi:hydrogenase/urease accessory protein HupE